MTEESALVEKPIKDIPMEYLMESGVKMKLTMAMVRNYLVQGKKDLISNQEIMYFMHECKARKLNPFLKECWLIKYSASDNAQIVESIHHKRALARSQPDCVGWEKGLILLREDGVLKKTNGLVLEGETVLGAYFKATPKGWEVPYKLEINLSGYIKKTFKGDITQFWQKKKQPSQIMKVVESQGLSALWGGTIGTNMIPEELPIDLEVGADGAYESVKEKTKAKIDAFKVKPNASLDEKVEKNKEEFDPSPNEKAEMDKIDAMAAAANEPDKRLGHQGGSTPQKGTDEKVECKWGCGAMNKPGQGQKRHENWCIENPANHEELPQSWADKVRERAPQIVTETIQMEDPDADQDRGVLSPAELQGKFPNIHPDLFSTPEFETLANLLKSERARVVWNKPEGWGSTDITDAETLTVAFGKIVKLAPGVKLGNHEGHEE